MEECGTWASTQLRTGKEVRVGPERTFLGPGPIRFLAAYQHLTVCVVVAAQDAGRRPETQGRCRRSQTRQQQTRVKYHLPRDLNKENA